MKKIILTLTFLLTSSLNSISFAASTATAPEKCPENADGYCIELQEAIGGKTVIKGETGVDLISNYISILYKYGASIIGILCVFIIVLSGIQISMGGANSEMVNKGKERIIQAIFSLILLFCSALILKTINPGFFT
ncbi:hypothetical protein KAI58_04445 [Candidatus Gracilibacteria bacterium]|nr:hypothetical protein [Candidatus Gracilibacteria bacterium]